MLTRDKTRASKTVKSALNWAIKKLKNANIANAEREALYLLSFIIRCSNEYLIAEPDYLIRENLFRQFEVAVGRRASGCPLAYITHRKEFFGLDFYVDKRVLIPRPETEILVQTALKILPEGNIRILDLGTGSGCIAISLAKERPDWRVFASDISFDALVVAKRNADVHKVKISFAAGNLLKNFKDASFDAIITNPPYVSEAEWEKISSSITDFEPKIALFGGKACPERSRGDGTDIILPIIETASRVLRKNGYLITEISPGIIKQTLSKFNECEFSIKEIVKDYTGNERVIVGTKKTFKSV